MNLKNLNDKSGFMLSEVLIAMAVIAIAITPALSQLGVLRFLYDYSRQLKVTFANKNILAEQTFRAKEDKKQKSSFEKADKKTGIVSKYVRNPIKKGIPPLKKLDAKQIKNLCKQEATTTYKKVSDSMFSFLYKPLKSKS